MVACSHLREARSTDLRSFCIRASRRVVTALLILSFERLLEPQFYTYLGAIWSVTLFQCNLIFKLCLSLESYTSGSRVYTLGPSYLNQMHEDKPGIFSIMAYAGVCCCQWCCRGAAVVLSLPPLSIMTRGSASAVRQLPHFSH